MTLELKELTSSGKKRTQDPGGSDRVVGVRTGSVVERTE